MANCEITDRVGYTTAAGVFTGTQSLLVYAVPDASWRTYDVGAGVYRPLGLNATITTAAYQRGRYTTTDSNGSWSFVLPYPAATHPSTPTSQWSIVLPSGDIWTGTVPAAAGPFTIDDLRLTYSWTATSSVYVAPVTPGTLVRGTATFTAATSAAILFALPFASSAYQITLTPSLDTVSLTAPVVAWSSKTTTGFTINVSGVFTGSVDWEAVL